MAYQALWGLPNPLHHHHPQISSLSLSPARASHIDSLLFLDHAKIFLLPGTTFFQISTWLPSFLPPSFPVWFTHTYTPFPSPFFIAPHGNLIFCVSVTTLFIVPLLTGM